MEISMLVNRDVEIKVQVPLDGSPPVLKVADIKLRIQSLIGVAAARQTLYFINHKNITYTPVSDEWLIQEYNITNNCFFSVLIRYPSAIVFAPYQNIFSLLCHLGTSKRFEYLEIGLRSRVEELKLNIANREMEMIHPSFYKVFLHGIELEDQWVIGNLEGIFRDDAVMESCLINADASKMGHPMPHILVLFAPMEVKVQRTLTVQRSFDDLKKQTFNDLRKQLETMRKESHLDLPHNWCFVFNNYRIFVEFVPLVGIMLKNNDVMQMNMVEPNSGTRRLKVLVQLTNDSFIFPVEVIPTSQMKVLRTELNRLHDIIVELRSVQNNNFIIGWRNSYKRNSLTPHTSLTFSNSSAHNSYTHPYLYYISL